MNEGTLVVVHCYAGDKHQVEAFLPEYLHHGCPVLVLSPEDAPVHIEHPDVTCRSAGLAGWEGPQTIRRQIAHWKIIAEWPQKYLLLHDADSICVTPEIPDYLYSSPGGLWSNETGDNSHLTYNSPLNMWNGECYVPPYFLTHDLLDKFIEAAESPEPKRMERALATSLRRDGIIQDWAECNDIDVFYRSIVFYLGIPHRNHPYGCLGYAGKEDCNTVTGPINMPHGVKNREALDELLQRWSDAAGR